MSQAFPGRDSRPAEAASRIWRRLTHSAPEPESCDYLHARPVEDDSTGKPGTALVCERCDREFDAGGDPAWRRGQARDAKICVDCGGPCWTVGTRRSV